VQTNPARYGPEEHLSISGKGQTPEGVTLLPSADSPTRPGFMQTVMRIALSPNTRLLAFALATGYASLGQASAQGPLEAEQPTTIHGTVVNSVTHAPISRALVYSPDNRYAMFTDGEGHFEFTLPKANNENQSGIYSGQPRQMWAASGAGSPVWLMARKPGYLDDPNESWQSAPPGGDNTISLMPEALIKGRVVISEADPPLGVNVQLYSQQVQDGLPRWVQSNNARTNSEGEFRFAELQPGNYKVLTNERMDNDPVTAVPGGQAYGFPPVFYPGAPDFASSSTISLTAGQSVQIDLPLTRQPYYLVSIPVANPDQSGGMNITVSVQGHGGPGYALGYNPSKQTIEGSLPNGNYLVEAITYGQPSLTGAVRLAVAGAPAHGPAMTLIRSSSVEVRVSEDFSRNESSNYTTWSNSSAGSFELHGTRSYFQPQLVNVDDFAQQPTVFLRPPSRQNDDALIFENLSPGKYWLRPGSNRGYVSAATIGTIDLLHEPLTVVAGSTGVIDVKMRDDYAELDGTVTGIATESIPTAGTPASSIYLYCVPLSDGPGQFQQLGTSSLDGTFMSDRMVPGSYRILAFWNPQPRLPYRDPEAMKAYESLGPVVRLSPGQKTTVQVPIISSIE
jgi:hypothetical protein